MNTNQALPYQKPMRSLGHSPDREDRRISELPTGLWVIWGGDVVAHFPSSHSQRELVQNLLPYIAVKGDRIVQTGLSPRNDVGFIELQKSLNPLIQAYGPVEEIIDGRGFSVVPGMINSHTHVAMGFFRGHFHQPPDGPTPSPDKSETIIETQFFPMEKSLSPELVEPLCYSSLLDGIRSGTTYFNDHYYFAGAVGRALKKLGVQGALGETLMDQGGPFPGLFQANHNSPHPSWKRYLQLQKESKLDCVMAPHAADTVSMPFWDAICEMRRQNPDLPLHMHLAQSAGERQRVLDQHNCTPVQLMDRLGLLNEHCLLTHMLAVDEDDLKIVKNSGATIVFCPSSQIIYENLAPIDRFMEHEIPLALGTDCAASSDGFHLLAELRMAGLLMRDRSPEGFYSPSRLFEMITTQPARVLGRQDMGCIQAGASADLVFFPNEVSHLVDADLSPEASRDLQWAQLIYSRYAQTAEHVLSQGKWVLWHQTPVQMSLEDMKEAYTSATAELKKRARS